MKTKADFERMTTLQLRQECKDNTITGYGRMTKDQMVEKLSGLSEKILGEFKEEVIDATVAETTETPKGEKVWTDRHLVPIVIGQRVNARIGGRWFMGTVVKFKEITGEDYVSILLDGRETSKLFHSVDVEILLGDKQRVEKEIPKVEEEKSPEPIDEKQDGIKKAEKKSKATHKQKEIPSSIEGYFDAGTKVEVEKSDSSIVKGEIVKLKFNDKGVPFYLINVDGKVISRVPKFVKIV